ncbi:MAG: Ig-like domain-containing protein, partial [Candidatus Thiodiazotropha endolucinida]
MRRRRSKKRSNTLICEELEPRILLSADLVGVAVDPASNDVEQQVDETELQTIEAGLQSVLSNQTDESDISTRELVIIDPATPDYQSLVDDLISRDGDGRSFEIVLLDSSANGIEQLNETLAQYQGLNAIHLISHGGEGEIRLGNATLNQDGLQQSAEQISAWGEALNPGGDWLIYGCDIASTATGERFIEQFAALTGADVAASNDVTGHETLDGDWDLEVVEGSIETDVAVGIDGQQAWLNRLDITTGLLGHWTLDSDATDSSGNSHDGTLTNGASIDNPGSSNPIGDGNLNLDGFNDFVQLNTHVSAFSGLSEGTIAAWINTSYSGAQAMFSITDTADSSSVVVFGMDNGRIFFDVVNNSFYSLSVETNASYADGSWHHVAVTVDGSGNSIYIDGVEVSLAGLFYRDGNSSTSSFFSSVTSLDSMAIGNVRDAGGYIAFFNGLQDDVRVYDRALSTSDIAELLSNTAPTFDAAGPPSFTAHTITSSANGAAGVSTVDIDGDGDLDVVSASQNDNKIAWYENDGSQNFTAHTITTSANTAFAVTTADVDGDGDIDVLSASVGDDRVVWYENDGNENFTTRTITFSASGASFVGTVDLDEDGDLDVLSTSAYDGRVAWYENDGNENFTTRTVTTSANEARQVVAVDVDGDGDLDLLSASRSSDKLAWYENDGFENFTLHTITAAAGPVSAVAAADIDGDGDLDVISASYTDDNVVWFENDGSENFTANTIASVTGEAFSVAVADMDGDGDVDVLATDDAADTVTWYENVMSVTTLDGAPTFVEDGAAVVLDADVNVSDAELDALSSGQGDYNGASLTLVRNGAANSDDVFSFNDGNGITLSGSNLIKSSQIIASFDTTSTAGELVITFTNANGQTPTSADVDNILRQITYSNSNDAPPASVQIDWTFDDGNTGSQGSGGALQAVGSTTVTITAVNDDPTNAGSLPTDITVAENVSSNVDLSAVDFSDVDAGVGTLTVTLTTSTGGNLSAAAGTGITIGGTSTARTLTGTLTDLNNYFNTASNITYLHGTPDTNGDDADTINITINDNGNTGTGGGTNINLGTVNVDITPDNEVPTIANLGGDSLAYNEDDGAQVIDQGTASIVADVDSSDFDTGTLTVSFQAGSDNAEDVLAIRDQGAGPTNITVSGSAVSYGGTQIGTFTGGSGGTNLVITLDADADATAVTALVRNITYENTDTENPTTGARTVRFVLTDGDGGTSVDYDTTVTVSTVNDDPTNAGSLPSDISVTEDVSSNVDLSAINFADVDAGGGTLTVTLTTSIGGNLSAAAGTGITIAGTSKVLTLTGTLTDLNNYFDTASNITYLHGTAHTAGNDADTIYVTINDNGNTGAGGGTDIDLGTVNVDISAVNEAPSFDGVPSFGEQIIDAAADGANTVHSADVDGDGDIDVLSTSSADNTVAWHENDGSGNFTKHVITNTAIFANDVTTADVDGDGDLDVLSSSSNDNTIAWYENDGSQNFTRHAIANTTSTNRSVTTADVDGDGDFDILSASFGEDTIGWYENDGNGNFTEQTVTTSADGARAVDAADVDGDGDLDVLSASGNDDKIAWYENDGSQNFTAHTITTSANGARSVTAGDMDGDGDLDVLSASSTDATIAWYENDGSENFSEHIISNTAGFATSVAVADVTSDGDLDVLSAANSADEIAWYENVSTTTLDGTPAFTEDGPAVVLDADVDISDPELDALNGGNGDYDGASVTLVRNGAANSEDVFSFNDGNGITLSGSNLIKSSQIVASFDTTTTAGELVITFTNANGQTPTSADVNNILRQITYANSNDVPPASVQIDWTFNDGNAGAQGSGGALQAVGSTTVTITAVNDTPTLAATAANDTLTENTDTTSGAVFATVTIDPIEAGDDIASAQLALGGGIDNSDTLTINGTAISGLGSDSSGAISGGHSYSYTQATGVVTITFAGGTNAAAAELVLESITYGIDPAADNPSTTARTITLNTVTDNGGGSDTSSDIGETATISVGAVNDNPTNAGSLPSDISVTEDVSSNIDLSAIDFADVDAASGTLTVTLTTSTGGDLSAAAGTGITIGGTSTARTLTGTLSDLNNYFNTASNITYLHGTTNTAGNDADTINVTINDNGNTGSGGGTDIDLGTVNVDIAAVNDDPSNAGSLPSDISVTEDVSSNIDLSAIDFSDIDAGAGTLTVTLTTSTGGDLSAAAGTGITIGGTSTALTLTGTLTDLNNYFNTASNITYLHGTTNTAGNDADTINVTINDNGNTGSGGGTDIDLGTINVDIAAVNDDPTNAGSLPSDISVTEDVLSNVDLSAVDFADVDAASGTLTVTLTTSTGGDLTAAAGTGITIGGTSTARTLTGTLTDLNNYFNTASNITYLHGTANTSGNDADTIQVDVTDNGNTGTGGGAINLGTVNVDITAVNDAPVVVDLDGDIHNFTEGDGVVLIEQGGDAVVSDSDSSDYAGGSLTVEVDSGLQPAEDRFSIFNQGTDTGEIGLSGGNVTYSGTLIGTVTGGTGIDPLTVTFNSNATSAAVTALVRNITYENSNLENPADGTRSVTIDITDGDGASSLTQNLTLNVSSVNDAPVVDLNGADGAGVDFAVTFTEDGGAVSVVDTDATISDVDNTTYQNLSINLSGFLDGVSEQITIAGYVFTYGSSDNQIRTVGSTDFEIDFDGTGFNVMLDGGGGMPEADLQSLLRGVTYENTSQDPTAGDRTINFFAQNSSLLNSPVATSTITVNPQNDAPTATDNANSVSENGFVSGNVITDDSGSGVDSDPEGDGLQVTQVEGGAYTPGLPVTLASGAQVTFQSNGSYTYNTNGQFYGLGAGSSVDDNFTYQIGDGNGGFDTATVTITINGSNNTPSITSTDLTLDEGQTVTLGDANFAVSDADDTDFTYTVSGISGGYFQLSTNPGVSITSFTSANLTGGLVQFVDDGNEVAPAFSVTVNDGDIDSNTLAATINFTLVSDSTPVANIDSITVAEGGTATTLVGGSSTVLNNDTGLVDVPVTVSLVSDVTNGSLTLNGDGTFSYTPDGSENFTDSFTYRVTDNDGETADATVTINITPVSDQTPVANADSITVAEGATATTLVGGSSTVLNNDTGLGDTPVTVSLVTDVTNGTLTLNGDGTFSYTHDGSENFTDSFTYRVTDNDGQTADATVTINITPVSDATPVANADSISVAEGGTITTLVGGASTVLNNDTGLGDTPVTVSLVTDVTNGSLTLNGDGTFSYTHDGSENFTDSFTYRVTDNDGETADATVTINVTPVSDETPVANADSITVAEGGTVTTLVGGASTVLNNDTGLGDTPVIVSLITDVANGSLTLNGDGTFSYTHDGSENFTDSFTYRVTDNDGETADATVTINITPVSDQTPVANADSITVAEGATATTLVGGASTVLNNDTGLGDTPVTVSLVTDVTNGTLTLNGDGTFSYTHDGSENFTDSFTYRVTDNDGETADATVTINVTSVSDATPVANADSITVAEGATATTLVGGSSTVLNNDTGLGDTPVIVSLITNVTNGSLTLNGDGTFSYTHDGSENFTDSFTYRITDNDGETADATVTINVTPVSDATPVANADSITVAEGATATTLVGGSSTVLNNDTGLGDTPVTVSLVTDVTNGTLTLNGDGTFSYTHDGSENFTDSFTYRVTDNDGETADATVTINITPVSDQTPVANADSITVAEGATATTLVGGSSTVLNNDTGLVDAPVTVSLVSDVTNGSLTLNGDGTFSYTHDGSENFTDSFTYRVTDNDGQTADATVTINITPVSDATPVANADSITVAEGGTVTTLVGGASTVLNNDTGLGDTPVIVSLITNVTNGSLTLNGDGTFSYTHDGSENFTDSFTYRITDNDGQTADATVTINITPVSDATPVANADSITVGEGGTVTTLVGGASTVLDNDTGLGDTPVTVSLVTDVTNGSLTLNGDGTFSYTHDGSENFTDSFTYRVTDNDGETADATVTINVTPVSDETPVANADSITVAEGATATTLVGGSSTVLNNDTGLGDTPVTVSLVTDVTNGSLTLNGDGTFSYTHDGSENFTDSFTYRVTDNDGETADATVTINITPVSDQTPVANADSITVAEGATATTLVGGSSTVLNNDTGLGDTPVTVSLVTDVTNGSLILNGDGTFSYTHDGSENFTDSFTYRVTDNDGETADATVTINVTPVSDATPVANADSITVAEGATATTLVGGSSTVLNNDTGLSDTPVMVSLVTDVTNGTLNLNGDGTFSYTHDGSENFTDSFTYRVTDNDGETADATVTINVTPVSDATPVANADSITVAEGATATTLVGGSSTVLNNDTGLGDTPVTVSLVTDVTNGTLTLNSDGTFSYSHDGSENFTDSFTYRITDNDGETADATVTINITPVSDQTPVANADSITVAEGATATTLVGGSSTVLNNDTGLGDTPVTVSLVTDVTNGSLTLNGDGTFSYTHDGSENFTDSFTYRVTDNDGETADATVTINVTPVS